VIRVSTPPSPSDRRRRGVSAKPPAPTLSVDARQQLGLRLRELRKQAGLPLREVESRTGISYSELSLLERGRVTSPPFPSLLALREAYDVPTLELLFGRLPSDSWIVLVGLMSATG
jgi:hypothetical protein